MRHQKRPYTCGPASVANALKCYRRRISETRLAKAAGTTKEEGTSEDGIYAAVIDSGLHHEICEAASFQDAYAWLREQLEAGRPVILCVSNWGHYITAIGLLGQKVVVFDPALDAPVRRENGVFVYTQRRLRKLWYHPTERAYWAMAVKRVGT